MSAVNENRQEEDNANRLKQVIDMGFSEERAKDALKKCNNNPDSAVNYLLANPDSNPESDPELAAASNVLCSGSKFKNYSNIRNTF